jgi:hypothetical protein
VHWNILIKDHSLHYFHYSFVLSLCYTILLRIVGSGELPLDPDIFTKVYKLSFEVYSPPLFDLSILIFLSEIFSIKDLNSLNLLNTLSFDFKK